MARAHPYNHMTGFIIDTLKLARRLQESGMKKETAEVLAEDLKDIQENALRDVATRQNIESFRAETKNEIESLRLETRSDIEGLRTETKSDIGGLSKDIEFVRKDIENLRLETRKDIDGLRLEMRIIEQRLVMKLGGLIALAVAVISFLDKVIV